MKWNEFCSSVMPVREIQWNRIAHNSSFASTYQVRQKQAVHEYPHIVGLGH